MLKQNILAEAAEVTGGDRNKAYGDPLGNHGTTGDMFRVYLRRRYGPHGTTPDVDIDAQDVCVFNICQKLSRLAHTPYHRDSLVDIAGYADNIDTCAKQKIEEWEWEEEKPPEAACDACS